MAGCHVQPEQMFNLIWGYNAPYIHYAITTGWLVTYNVMVGDVVPVGEVWVATSAFIRNTSRACSMAISMQNGAGVRSYLGFGITVAAGGMITWNGMAILPEAAGMIYEVWGTVAGDDGDWGSQGYKMKLTQ